MTQLTKEYFDEHVAKLATAKALAEVDSDLDELASIVKKGFDGTDEKLADIAQLLDVRSEVDLLKQRLQDVKEKLESALHVKL